ncbi:hypothetical protein [Nocardia sp. CA-119907]|uniref:hypothetical protein n=1 Tax=Nocardia sp. CA-119907 TaxID=3239973 RepID=UPI003D97A5A4
MGEHRTEVDGWLAVWRIDRHRIRMMLVRNLASAETLASFHPARCPDLAQMRERFPKLSRLWDAVRHEYWTELIPAQRCSRGMTRVMSDRNRHPANSHPLPERLNRLSVRATRAGYRLVRGVVSPYVWELLDADDDELIYSAASLDEIEDWLRS